MRRQVIGLGARKGGLVGMSPASSPFDLPMQVFGHLFKRGTE